MPQRRELPPHAASIYLIGKKFLQEFANLNAACGEQRTPALFQKLRELANVCGVGTNRKWRKSFLDSQVVEKTGEYARTDLRRHSQEEIQYARYRTCGKVTNRVRNIAGPSLPAAGE